MTERDVFERRFAEAVRAYAEGAPTEIDAAALVHSLSAGTPRVRRLVPVSPWRLPIPRFAWGLVLLVLLVPVLAGLSVVGAFRDLRLPSVMPPPSRPQVTVPAIVGTAPPESPSPAPSAASPAPATTPANTAPASPGPSPGGSPAPAQASTPPYAATLAWSGFAQLPRADTGHVLTTPTIGDVTAGGPGFVAVGSDWLDAEQAVAVAWVSRDGRAWTEHAIGIPGVTSVLASPALVSVAGGSGTLVAVGRVGIWRSSDGVDWAQALGPDEMDGQPLRVAWGDAGFVAVGRSTGDPCSMRAWVSPDGAAWQPVALPGSDRLCPTGLAAGPAGYLAVGRDPVTGRAALMRSPDGLSWSLVPAQAAFDGDGYPEGAAWAGGRWVAFGSFLPAGGSERGVAVWSSGDGLAWQRTAFLRPTLAYACDPGSAHMLEVVPFGPGYVGVGWCIASPEQVGVAWASTDGATWQAILGRVRPLLAVASDGNLLVAVGADWPDHAPVTAHAVVAP